MLNSLLVKLSFNHDSESNALSRGCVKRHDDLLDVLIPNLVEVDGSGKPSLDASVGVLNPAFLPERGGVTEVGDCGEHVAQQDVAGEVSVIAKGNRSAYDRIQALEHGY